MMNPLALRLLLLSAGAILCVFLTVTAFNGAGTVTDNLNGAISTAGERLGLHQDDIPNSASHAVESALSNGKNSNTKDGSKNERLAYMTFLSGTMANASETDFNQDPYFVATRLLGYQLMHQPETRSPSNIPFVVLVTPDVPKNKRNRLAQDGAVIIDVDYVPTPDWVQGEMPQWRDLMTKLRAWQQVQYSRALFLDGDMILNAPLDDIFADTATQFTSSLPGPSTSPGEDVPPSYLLATMAEANPIHAYPPTANNSDYKDPTYFNAGFFLFGPSPALYTYYTSLLAHDHIFDPRYVEQNLLNYAHRQDGRMPWQGIDTKWNIRFPSTGDKEAGVVSMHDKWWSAHMDQGLQPYYSGLRWRMEGFYEGFDFVSRNREGEKGMRSWW